MIVGDAVTFEARLSPAPGPGDTTKHVLNVQVHDASGRILHHYRRNTAFQSAQCSYVFHSALNEKEGPLRFTVTLLPEGISRQIDLQVDSC